MEPSRRLDWIVFDHDPRVEVQSLEWSRRAPRQYLYVFREAAKRLGLQTRSKQDEPRSASVRRTLYITWRPSWGALAHVLRGGKLYYIAFGVPTTLAARIRVHLMLRLATRVFVIDRMTRLFMRRYLRASPHKMAYLPTIIDLEFLRSSASQGRGDYAVCLGDADRDETLIVRLAERIRVQRVTSNETVRRRYDGIANVDVLFRVDYERLIDTVAQAAFCFMPIHARHHAAGMTAVGEALALGTDVYTTSLIHHHAFGDLVHYLGPGDAVDVPVALARRDAPRDIATIRERIAPHEPDNVAERLTGWIRKDGLA